MTLGCVFRSFYSQYCTYNSTNDIVKLRLFCFVLYDCEVWSVDSLYLQYSSVLCQLEITCDLWVGDGGKYFNIVNPNIHLFVDAKEENKQINIFDILIPWIFYHQINCLSIKHHCTVCTTFIKENKYK